jgi:hypothetical protein
LQGRLPVAVAVSQTRLSELGFRISILLKKTLFLEAREMRSKRGQKLCAQMALRATMSERDYKPDPARPL